MIRPDGHSAACPCKNCIAYDVARFKQERPHATWDPTAWLEQDRNRDLNWDIEPGHCLLCGGISAADTSAHFMKERYNEKQVGELWFTSLLIHKAGPWIRPYRDLLVASQRPRYPALKPLQERLADWACLFLELNPEKFTKLASREHEDWIELRLGFTELQDEDYEQRTKRVGDRLRTEGRGKDSARLNPAPEAFSGQF
jgi:hypothetical protein